MRSTLSLIFLKLITIVIVTLSYKAAIAQNYNCNDKTINRTLYIRPGGKNIVDPKTNKNKRVSLELTSKDNKRKVTEKKELSYVTDLDGRKIYKQKFISIRKTLALGFFIGKTDQHKFALFNENLIQVLTPEFDEIHRISTSGSWLARKGTLWALYNDTGNQITDRFYDNISVLNDSLIIVREKENQILINSKGDILRELGDVCFFYEKNIYSKTISLKSKDEKIGIVGLDGKLFHPAVYDKLKPLGLGNEGFIITKDKKSGLIKSNGDTLFNFIYDEIRLLRNFEQNNVYYPIYVLKKGNQVELYLKGNTTKINADDIHSLDSKFFGQPRSTSFLKYIQDGDFGILHLPSCSMTEAKFGSRIKPFNDSLVIASVGSKGYNLVNKNGELFLNKFYNEITNPPYAFRGNTKIDSPILAKVIKNSWSGLVNIHGDEIIPCLYDKITIWDNLDDKSIRVQKGGKYGLYNDNYKLILPVKYDEVRAFEEKRARISIDEKWGFIDLEGNEVIPPKYDLVEPFENGKSLVTLNGKEFYIDHQGNCIENCE